MDPVQNFLLKANVYTSESKLPKNQKKSTGISWRDGLSLIEEGVSFSRDIGSAIPLIGPEHSMISRLGSLSGGIGFFTGGVLAIKDGLDHCKEAKKIRDKEGVRQAKASTLIGVTFVSGSGFSFVKGVLGMKILGMGALSSSLLAISSMVKTWKSALGSYRSFSFYREYQKRLDDPSRSPIERKVAAIEFLRKEALPTKEEVDKICRKGREKYGHLAPETKELLIQQKIERLAARKIQYCKERVGKKIVRIVIEKGERLHQKLQSQSKDLCIYNRLNLVFQKIRWENTKKMGLFLIAALISAIGLAALIVASTVPGVAYILYAVSGAISFALVAGPFIVQDKKSDTNLLKEAVRQSSCFLTN